jgi:hypothetical protein
MKPLDNLCHPTSVIHEAEMLAADAFGAAHAFLMVGGTTSSVQSMVLSTCKRGDKIILPRNVHRSVINALVFLSTSGTNWYPEDLLHDIHRCLDEGKKDICVIWHELEDTGSSTDKAIETFANINANKIPLTDAELIKAVLMQAYGKLAADKEDEVIPAAAVLQEATFANQWETIERGLNKNDFWCFFVKKTGGYKTRIDLLFEIWLATEGVSLSSDDHALYRAVLAKLLTDGVEQLWHSVVTIYETLQDWHRDYYTYHMIGACSLLGKKESNANFVCNLYQAYNQKTQSQFRNKLKDTRHY